MAEITLSGPSGFYGGVSQIDGSGPFVGYVDDKNYILRYSFTTPSDGYITSVTFATKFRHYTGDAGTTFEVRVKITENSTSHINAGIGTTDYEAIITKSGTGIESKSCTIDGLWLKPNTTYYLYLFPGTQYFLYYCYDNSGVDYATLSYDSIVSTNTLNLSVGTGSTITVNRTSSPSGSTGVLTHGATLYTGDVLVISFSVGAGYNLVTHTVNGSAFASGDSHTVTGDVSVASTAALKIYKLTISQGTGSIITVKRGNTTLDNGATITHGDVLAITFGASVGYYLTYTSHSNGDTVTVEGNVSVSAVAAVLQYFLSISTGTGSTITVIRTSSPLQGASSGSLTDGAAIFHGDILAISFAGSALYEILTQTINGLDAESDGSYTVTGPVSIVTTTRMLDFVHLTVGGIVKKFRIIIYHNSKWVKYRPVILHSDTDISAIGIGDAIVVTTSLPVTTDGDTIIIGGA